MHRFDGYDIEVTQGDTLFFKVELDGRKMPEGSVGYFTVKSSPKSDEVLVQKKLDASDGVLDIRLMSEDTNLPVRTYYWDVRVLIPLEEGGYEVETPMEFAAFTILAAIGTAGEGGDGVDADLPVLSVVLNEARALVADIEQKLENGELNGRTPVKGVDYFTSGEVADVARQAAGMVDTQTPVDEHDIDLNAHNGLVRTVQELEGKIDNIAGTDPEYVLEQITQHNEDPLAHDHIQSLISQLSARINGILDSEDINLDQLSEIVAYIKSNKELIDAITTRKVSVADIVDGLTSTAADKPLSARQGAVLRQMIENIDLPDAPVTSVNSKTGAVELTAEDVAALPLAGGRLTGSLNLGHVQSRDSVLMTMHRQGSDGASKLQLQLQIDDQDSAILNFFKDGVLQNRMRMFADKTTIGKPLDIAGGGHGGTTAAEARANLGITPQGIGAVPLSGGTMSGNLTVGNGTEGNAPMLLLKRLMSDGATNGNARLYMTASGNLKIDLYQGDTRVNSWTLAPDTVTEIPTTLPSPGVLTLTGAVSGTYDGSENKSIEIPTIAGPQGPAGADGEDGYTPVRGTDYWTASDIAEIKGYVDSAILNGSW